MKINLEKKYYYAGITAFLVIVLSFICAFLILGLSNIMAALGKLMKVASPILNGFLISYLVSPFAGKLEHNALPKLFKGIGMKPSVKRDRFLSILITLVGFIAIIAAFISLVLPQIVNSISSIIASTPEYMANLDKWMRGLFEHYPFLEKMLDEYSVTIQDWFTTDLLPQVKKIITSVSNGIFTGMKAVWNIILGVIISAYILSIRRGFQAQARKVIFALCRRNTACDILDEFKFINATFLGYIESSLVDSLIIGIICFIVLSIMQMPYTMLVSVIVGVTNIIPFFGPFLGAIPSILIILFVNPLQALYFLIFIVILQQCDGNVIKPKLFGDSTGLSGFWIIASILVGGGLFGIAGMFLGVPVFAVIYNAIRRIIEKRLAKKGLPTSTAAYYSVNNIISSKSERENEEEKE